MLKQCACRIFKLIITHSTNTRRQGQIWDSLVSSVHDNGMVIGDEFSHSSSHKIRKPARVEQHWV